MRQKWIKSVLLTTVLMSTAVLESSCTTITEVKAAKGTGIVSICKEPYDLAWAGLLDLLTSIRISPKYSNADLGPYFKLKIVDPANGEIVAKGSHPGGPPEVYVAVYVTKIDDNKTRVEILSKQALKGSLSGKWDETFSDAIRTGCSTHQPITHVPWNVLL